MQHNELDIAVDFLYIIKQVDIFQYPSTIDRHHVGDEITIGDMHGHPIKELYYYIRNGVISITPEDFNILVAIYNSKSNSFQHFTEADLIAFEQALNRTKKELSLLVRTIGDTKADRAICDILMEMLDKRKHELEINYRNIFSNHDLEYIYWYEHGYDMEKYPHEYMGFPYDVSLTTYSFGIKEGKISHERIELLNAQRKDYYKEHLYLTDYTLSPNRQTATFYTHAATGLDVLRANAAQLLPSQYTLNDETFTKKSASELAEVVDEVNAQFKGHALNDSIHTICPPGYPNDRYMLNPERPLLFTAWNRNSTVPHICPAQFNFVHGHHKITDPMPINEYCLDNKLGMSPEHHQDEYTLLISLSAESQQLENKEAYRVQWQQRKQGETPSFDLLKAITIMAAHGDTELQYQLACYYYEELATVQPDMNVDLLYTNYRSEGARWLQRAAQQGHGVAKLQLAGYLTNDKEAYYYGIKYNPNLAYEYYSQLLSEADDTYLLEIEEQAKYGNLSAVQVLLTCRPSHPDTVLFKQILAAEKNDIEAIKYCLEKLDGEVALKLIERQVRLKNFDVCFLRAQSFYTGNDRYAIPRDLTKSRQDFISLMKIFTDQPHFMIQIIPALMSKQDLYAELIENEDEFLSSFIDFFENNKKVNDENSHKKVELCPLLNDLSKRGRSDAQWAMALYFHQKGEVNKSAKRLHQLFSNKNTPASLKEKAISYLNQPENLELIEHTMQLADGVKIEKDTVKDASNSGITLYSQRGTLTPATPIPSPVNIPNFNSDSSCSLF